MVISVCPRFIGERHLYFFIVVSPLSHFSPCPAALPPYIIVVLQVAIFSTDTDINGTTAQRKSKREGHGGTKLPFFLVASSENEESQSLHWSWGNADDTVSLQES